MNNHNVNLRFAQSAALVCTLLIAGCDNAPVEATPAEPEAPALPNGWDSVDVEVAGHSSTITTLAPSGHKVDAADYGTVVYGDLPGQTYPYYFELKHHKKAPGLHMILNASGFKDHLEDTAYGYRAEQRQEDGNGWNYVVYNDSLKLSCKVSLSSSDGVGDALIEEARRPCDAFAK